MEGEVITKKRKNAIGASNRLEKKDDTGYSKHPGRRTFGLLAGESERKTVSGDFFRTTFYAGFQSENASSEKKSRAALTRLNMYGAHPVSMLFSGAGVPLFGMFQGVGVANSIVSHRVGK